jgi:molybdenum cofactor biosynthesis enzyme MoaA
LISRACTKSRKPSSHRCFATFRDLRGQLSLEHALTLLRLLREAGCEKLNFAGGEPTLHPHIGPLLSIGAVRRWLRGDFTSTPLPAST